MVRASNTRAPPAPRKFFFLASTLPCSSLLCSTDLFAQSAEWERLTQETVSLYRQGDYKRAKDIAQQALKLTERELGPEHPDVATCLNNLAALYQLQGKFAQADPLQMRALAILYRDLEPNHPAVAAGLNNLALIYQHQGQWTHADLLYKRAMVIYETALGPHYFDMASAFENYAKVLRATEREIEATKWRRGRGQSGRRG